MFLDSSSGAETVTSPSSFTSTLAPDFSTISLIVAPPFPITVAAPDEDSRNKAMQMIKDLTAKAELNKIYNGKVMKIMEFGAFVNFLGKQDGLVHISELADKRVAKVTDVVKEGDEVKVKVIGFDRGKVKLSIKQAAI